MYLIDGCLVKSHGGSYRLVFSKTKREISPELDLLLALESTELLEIENIEQSIMRYKLEIQHLESYLIEQKSKGKTIYGFGASGRANMLLGNLNDSANLIEFVIDESHERINRTMAQNQIPIVDLKQVNFNKVDCVVVLAWNFKDKIIKKMVNQKIEVIVPLPKFEIINF